MLRHAYPSRGGAKRLGRGWPKSWQRESRLVNGAPAQGRSERGDEADSGGDKIFTPEAKN